jgi:hypothetical protein
MLCQVDSSCSGDVSSLKLGGGPREQNKDNYLGVKIAVFFLESNVSSAASLAEIGQMRYTDLKKQKEVLDLLLRHHDSTSS